MYDAFTLRDVRLKFLRENRPEELESLIKKGQLESHLGRMVRSCQEEAERLVATGVTFPAQARRWAIKSILLETEWD